MTIHNLDKIFRPKSIAVVGASETHGAIGSAIMNNLVTYNFPGAIYPVNPKYQTLWERPCHASISEIPDSADLAVIATPISTAPEIIKECAEKGIKGVLIISAGGKEIGANGKKTEEAIKKAAAGTGIRIIGPNCVGILSTKAKLNASFAANSPLPGKMAFISQSGAICTSILDLSIKENIGFSHFISLGSMLDVDFADVIDFLGNEGNVSSIVMYVESFSRFRKFMSAARAISRVKPIIALKAGRSHAGAMAAASHTGALAGEDIVYDAAFKRCGMVRVKTFEELFDCAELTAKQPRPRGKGLAIITNAGGPGVMAADALSDYDAEPAALSPETFKQLDEFLPPHWSKKNPIDIIGDAGPERYRKAVEVCLKAPEINGLLIMLSPQGLSDPEQISKALVEVISGKSIPIVTSWIGGPHVERGRDVFNQAGIPTFDTPERAVRAFMDLFQYSKNIEMLREIPSKLPKNMEFDYEAANEIIAGALNENRELLTETESKKILAAYGIPTNPTLKASSADEAVNKANEAGFPVVLKIDSPDISHKSDMGGVILNICNVKDVESWFAQIIEKAKAHNPNARLEGVTVQRMIDNGNYELIMGIKKDRDFGPVILFGMGGVLTEIIKDSAIALPPLNRLLARRLMEETKVYKLLKGYRDYPPVDVSKLEELLIRLSRLASDFSVIEELDINPLIVTDDRILAVDARIVVKPSAVDPPLHFVISPYPDENEARLETIDGHPLFIRPIRPEDAPIFKDLFESLSPRSIYYRFFSPIKALSSEMLAKFTQIDYDREIALVAVDDSGDEEIMLGVARIIIERNETDAEFSVLVRDAWHGKGIGAQLLERCLETAKERGIEKVWGYVLAENTQMLGLGKKLGFSKKRMPETSEYELTIEFSKQ